MNKLTWLMATASLGVVMVAGCGDDSSSLECGANTTEVNGVCVADTGTEITCGTGTVAMGTECVPDGSVICETGTTFDMASGTCVADITGCGTGTIVVDGECKDPADVTADVSEAAEPNDLGVDGTPGMIDLPIAGESITVSGCIEPTTGMDGLAVVDEDAYIFQASGPTLLDITVDGFNGAAGAFILQPLDQELNDSGFVRFGIDLANDMSQRQVFLPKATGYGITFADSRALFSGEAAGGPGACYLATISNVALPTPTAITVDTALDGTYGSDTQFLRFTPAADGAIATSATTAPNESGLIDSVLMVNGQYFSNNTAGRNNGDPAANVGAGLNVADMVTYVIDPVINLSVNPLNFSHIVSEVGSTPIPTDGTTVSVPAPGDRTDETLDSYLSFVVANDGDVVYLDLDVSAYSTDVDWTILDNSLNDVAVIAGSSGGVETGHYQFARAGTYFIDIRDFSGSAVDPYDLTATQIDHTPTAVVVDTPFLAQTFGADKATFYIATPGAFDWWNVTGSPTNFDADMELDVYPANGSGKLGQDVAEIATLDLVDGEDNIQLFENAPPMLLKVSDSGALPAPTAAYDFSIANNPFTDLGFVDAATPVNMAVTGADADSYYIAQGNDGDVFNIVITGNNDFDPQLVLVSASGETVVDANTGADTNEANFTAVVNGRTPFIVRDAAGVGGDFTIDITFTQTLNLTSTPSLALPDNDAVGVQDTITVGACDILLIDVDVNVTHTWSGDILMSLTSPTATTEVLHNLTGGSADDVIGNYPNDLTPDGDLSNFLGEEAMGDWTLDISDNAIGDFGTLNSWGLNFVCN